MTMTTSVNKQPTATVGEPYTTGSVTSHDGATISYRQLGHGAGVVMLHGSMESAQSHMQLATALADAFTVYLPDRRGPRARRPYGARDSIQTEGEELDAPLIKSGAHIVFGVSSGGLICLHASLTLPPIRKDALYEPAPIVECSLS